MRNEPERNMNIGITRILLFAFVHLPYIIGERTTENARVVIIGSGPSGIAAAAKLFENGFKNVTILEAENRIGGRIHTTTFGDYIVDLGAQYIDGVERNLISELANPFGLIDVSNKAQSGLVEISFDSDGNPVNDEITHKMHNFYFSYINEVKFVNNSLFKSVGDYAEQGFNEHFKNDPSIMNDKQKYLFHLELMAVSDAASETWHDLSALAQNRYHDYAGDHLASWKNLGYSTVLDLLMKRYPDPAKELPVKKNILLNSEVTSIDYSRDTEILVTTSNGKIYEADHAILTVSLGYLKAKHSTLFNPKLPANKVDTIEAIGFGNLAKIYLLFDKPFWSLSDRRVIHFPFIWNDADKKAVEDDPDKEWLLGIVGANTVQYRPNLLQFWVGGRYNKLMEKLPEETVLNHTMETLNRFLGKNYNIPVPIGMMRSQWFSNPHFRGAYSYRSVETEKRNATAATLEEPLQHNNLTVMFAGEATSSDRYGTVDGAISTGWKAANRLIDLYKQSPTAS